MWNHFSVNYVNNESVCKACNRKIAGRNSTNAKNHLKSFHRSLYDQCTQLDDANLKSKKTKIHLHESSRSGCGVVGGIGNLLNNVKDKSLNKWAPDSSQKKNKDEALIKMIIECDLPFHVIQKDAFKNFCTTLDPKYYMCLPTGK